MALGRIKQYTAVFKKGEKTISKKFTVAQSGTEFTGDGAVGTYKDGVVCSDFTTSDTITVKATPTATGQAPTNSAMFAASFTGPGAGQMAVFVNDTQVSAPADVGEDGAYTMTVTAADVLTNGQAGQDNKYTLIVRFVENVSSAACPRQLLAIRRPQSPIPSRIQAATPAAGAGVPAPTPLRWRSRSMAK